MKMNCAIRQLLFAMAVAVACSVGYSQEVENETEALGKVKPEERTGAQFVIAGDDWVPLKYIKTPAAGGVLDFSSQPYIHRPAGKFLDLFTVPGLLLAAGLRMAEAELGSLGTGRFIEAAAAPSFPFAVVNEYGEAHVAVFFWEAAWALAVALMSLSDLERRPGERFETAVFRLCAGQILLEGLRSRSLSWGFVRVEQVLCAVILLVLMLLACRRDRRHRIPSTAKPFPLHGRDRRLPADGGRPSPGPAPLSLCHGWPSPSGKESVKGI